MDENRKVKKQHFPPERKNIHLSVGDEVEIGKEDTSNENWENWVWTISKKSRASGWVPRQYLETDGSVGKAIKEYSSVELQVSPNDVLTIHFYLNGWGWCTDSSGEQGWVPEENFE